jgi:hypothetical protein
VTLVSYRLFQHAIKRALFKPSLSGSGRAMVANLDSERDINVRMFRRYVAARRVEREGLVDGSQGCNFRRLVWNVWGGGEGAD